MQLNLGYSANEHIEQSDWLMDYNGKLKVVPAATATGTPTKIPTVIKSLEYPDSKPKQRKKERKKYPQL